MKLSNIVKDKDKAAKQLRYLCNEVLSAAQFGNIQNWGHVRDSLRLDEKEQTSLLTGLDLHARIKPAQVKDFLARFYKYRTEPPIKRLLPALRYPLDFQLEAIKLAWDLDEHEKELVPVTLQSKEEKEFNTLPPHKKPVLAKLRGFQDRAAVEIWQKLMIDDKPAVLLEAPTGTGKTYIAGRLIAAMIDSGYIEKHSVSPWPILYVTKAPIVEQTQRVLQNLFGLDCLNVVHVINIEQLRSKLGEQFIRDTIKVINGEPIIEFEWLPYINPLEIWWDECHILKNEGAQQHDIAKTFQRLHNRFPKIKQVFMSATPFMCVAETKVFTLAARVPYLGFEGDAPITEKDWSSWAARIAAPRDPHEFSPAAMERYMEAMKDYIVSVKNVRPQFKAFNKVTLCDFRTTEGKQHYIDAWLRFVDDCARINKELPGAHFQELVALLKFRIAAEESHAKEHVVEDILTRIAAGFSVFVACNFKSTITHLVTQLVTKHNISRNKISVIWGGDISLKYNMPTDEEAQEILRKIKDEGKATAADYKRLEMWVNYKEAEPEDKQEQLRVRELYKTLGLGPQSRKERQRQIDNYQRGNATICIGTFKSSGAGLSLHHSDDLTKEKVRRRENGWAVVEDIPKIPVKSRTTLVFPTWSAIELAQGLGRAPRLTSLSDTNQEVMGYRGTVEVRVLAGVSRKLRCLKKVVKDNSEAFAGAIYGPAPKEEDFKKLEVEVDTSVVEQEEQIDETEEE